MMNVPYNCSDSELIQWVESSGIGVKSVRTIRDEVAGVSPAFAYVEITDETPLTDAVGKLNGNSIRDRVILVSQARRAAPAA
jgi:RNA recognition motif-containing protein